MKAKATPKRVSKPTEPRGHVATQKQLSSALNERCNVPPSQLGKKKVLDQSKKTDRKNEKVAETVLDEALSKDQSQPSSAKKKLFSNEEDGSTSEDESDSKTHEEQVSSKVASHESEPTCSRCHLLKKHGTV